MNSLQTLNVSSNALSGSLPSSWAALSSLQHLDISNNSLEVHICDSAKHVTVDT